MNMVHITHFLYLRRFMVDTGMGGVLVKQYEVLISEVSNSDSFCRQSRIKVNR